VPARIHTEPLETEEQPAFTEGAAEPQHAPQLPWSRIQIEDPQPLIDCGRHPAKAVVGDVYEVSARIFRDGADVLRALVKARPAGRDARWHEAPMHRIDAHVAGDRWAGAFPIHTEGPWEWTIESWTDSFASWHSELERKVAAGQEDLSGELSEGLRLVEAAADRAGVSADADRLRNAAARMQDSRPQDERVAAALDPEVEDAAERHPDRSCSSEMQPIPLSVDRVRARFGSWYELFPRSWGGFAGVERQLPRLAELGFDVLYLPPIHPIGLKNRKGRNNALVAGPDDPGSPWAIGDATGGHTAIHPDLGTVEDFERLVRAAREHGIEIALDFAVQCSADHPWLTEHPEWFHRRPDGTLKYAENPPKKYQDIYNVDFACADWRSLWDALLETLRYWIDRGVTIFRVDNPHTKPVPFWEWAIGEIHRDRPDVLFLAEAFTRRAMMDKLAKIGFNQSYTYFTWQNSKWELTDYILQLAYSEERHFFRPNFFANTPDILTEYLQHGGRPAFEARLVLAATLSPTYGIYSGFEHFENTPVRPGSEEYLDSEKYEARHRGLDGPLLPLVQRLNEVRRVNPALQRLDNITFIDTANDALLGYVKRTDSSTIITVVNIDPHWSQEGVAVLPADLGLPPSVPVFDLLSGDRFDWRLGRNYVRLDPGKSHVLRVEAT
jgi:starch synthase (maltosyl-transferring)